MSLIALVIIINNIGVVCKKNRTHLVSQVCSAAFKRHTTALGAASYTVSIKSGITMSQTINCGSVYKHFLHPLRSAPDCNNTTDYYYSHLNCSVDIE